MSLIWRLSHTVKIWASLAKLDIHKFKDPDGMPSWVLVGSSLLSYSQSSSKCKSNQDRFLGTDGKQVSLKYSRDQGQSASFQLPEMWLNSLSWRPSLSMWKTKLWLKVICMDSPKRIHANYPDCLLWWENHQDTWRVSSGWYLPGLQQGF